MRTSLPTGYWSPKLETLPREELQTLQWRKLERQLRHLYARSPFYGERMDAGGCRPDGVRSLEDYYARFPVLTRAELIAAQQTAPPYGSLPAVPDRLAVTRHQTSGSSGQPPLRTFDTARDWAWVADMFATGLYGLGVRETDQVAVVFGYGLFIGFWAGHYGLQRIGATTISTGSFDSERRIQLLVEEDVAALLCTPTYALRLARVAEQMGVHLPSETRVRLVVVSGEPRPPAAREAIAAAFDAYVGEVAGMTEAGTLLMFECVADPGGMHIIETDVLEEVLDPVTHAPVGYGEQGVRVMTTLGREGIGMLRYWTNDLVVKVPHTTCTCGRTWDIYRGGILGRLDDVRKIRGVLFMPAMMEDVVRAFPDVEEFQTELRSVDALDTLLLRVEPRPDVPPSAYDDLRGRLTAHAKRVLSLTPLVEIAEQGTLPRFEMKSNRFRDVRGQGQGDR